MDIDRQALGCRMRQYYDDSVDWNTLKASGMGVTRDAARYDARATRKKVLASESFDEARFRRYALRPFDTRWCYYSPVRPLWNEPRPSYWAQCWKGNAFFMTRFRSTATPEGVPCYLVTGLSDDHFITPDNSCFPLRIRQAAKEARTGTRESGELFHDENLARTFTGNLSKKAREYHAELGVHDPDKDAETAGLIWMHALAIGYSPAYLTQNADGIRQDWPRVPLPAKKEALLASAELGRRVAALLDTENPVQGVTCGTIRPELKGVAVISKVGGGELDPGQGHLDLTAGWGHAGKGGACMPGTGKYVERTTKDERQKLLFGPDTLDVYLNDTAYWANVPRAVWDYYIGGYQVVKKWLSYREKKVLGRGLKIEEAEYVTEMVRRIAAIILLQPDLDANYQAVKSDTWPWKSPL